MFFRREKHIISQFAVFFLRGPRLAVQNVAVYTMVCRVALNRGIYNCPKTIFIPPPLFELHIFSPLAPSREK
jgi:hypothetical protein